MQPCEAGRPNMPTALVPCVAIPRLKNTEYGIGAPSYWREYHSRAIHWGRNRPRGVWYPARPDEIFQRCRVLPLALTVMRCVVRSIVACNVGGGGGFGFAGFAVGAVAGASAGCGGAAGSPSAVRAATSRSARPLSGFATGADFAADARGTSVVSAACALTPTAVRRPIAAPANTATPKRMANSANTPLSGDCSSANPRWL